MKILSLILFSLSTNLDNIPIGISYAIIKKRAKFKDIFFISLITSIITLLIMLLGSFISSFFSLELTNKIGADVIILIGILGISYNLFSNFYEKEKTPLVITSNLKVICILSINNLATGLSASITGINYLIASIFTFIFCILLLYIGIIIGKKLKFSFLDKYSDYISYIILLILGLIERKN